MEEKKGFFRRLVSGLAKTRDNIVSGMDSIFHGFSKIDEEFYEELEETLIMGDLGVHSTMEILEDLRAKVKERHIKEPIECRQLLIDSIREQMDVGETAYEFENRTSVVFVIGVNGVGKTTTIGKLAGKLKSQGKKVVLAAADTFRAAAGEQLREWANRADADMIGGQEGADPAAVIYDAVAAAKEAFADAGISMENEDPFRVGVLVGSGVGDLNACEQAKAKIDAGNPSRVNPFTVPVMIANMAAGNVAIALGAKGKCTSVVTACATGTHCIGDAFRAIQYNDADICVAGGAESAITPVGVAGFSALTALSESEDPLRASIPFDKDRNGFVMGEGAGILVLEELEHAKQRGAKIYAEVVGYGATCDAYHITSPLEDGSGAARAMELAMEEAGVKPEEVTYINAHGTSTHHNDLFETRAIRKAFGDAADHVLVNSTKSMVGHLLGAAGGVEAVVCAKSIQDGFVHQTIGTKEADAECDLNYCIGAPVETDVKLAMSNSLGFGGHNAVLLFQKYE